jgi:hypothetical protein
MRIMIISNMMTMIAIIQSIELKPGEPELGVDEADRVGLVVVDVDGVVEAEVLEESDITETVFSA